MATFSDPKFCYSIRIWGYGGEVVLGEIERAQFDYFKENCLSVSDYCYSLDYADEIEIPEEMRPFEPGGWQECDNLLHTWGCSKNTGTLQITDEKGGVVYERELKDLNGLEGVTFDVLDDAWLTMKGAGSTVFYNVGAEKGTFFEGEIQLTAPFEPEKLCLTCREVEGDEIISRVEYDGEEVVNGDHSTVGQSGDPAFYLVTGECESERYPGTTDDERPFDFDNLPTSSPAGEARAGEFSVTLTDCGGDKVAIVKEVRAAVPGLGVADAKTLVEGTPALVKQGLTQDQAQGIKKKIEAAGGKAEINGANN